MSQHYRWPQASLCQLFWRIWLCRRACNTPYLRQVIFSVPHWKIDLAKYVLPNGPSQMDPPKWTQIATRINRPHSRLDPTHIYRTHKYDLTWWYTKFRLDITWLDHPKLFPRQLGRSITFKKYLGVNLWIFFLVLLGRRKTPEKMGHCISVYCYND